MTGNSWADEAILGHCPCPKPLYRRLLSLIVSLFRKSIKLSVLIAATAAITLLVIVLLPSETLSQVEHTRQEFNKDATHLIKRKIIPQAKRATRNLKQMSAELLSGSSGQTPAVP